MVVSEQAIDAAQKTAKIPEKRTRYRWFVLAIIFCSYAMQYADRANIATVIPALRQEFTMTNLDAGLLMSFFFLGYVLTQIPSSVPFKKFGTRGLVPLSIIGFSAFTYLLGGVKVIGTMKWLRLGLGLAEGPSPIGITTTINNWFPPKEKATAVGLGYVGPTMMAPILVPIITAWLIVHFGWRSVFFWFSIPGFVLAAVWYILVRTKPEECSYCSKSEVEFIRDTQILPIGKTVSSTRPSWRFDKLLRVRKLKLLENGREVVASKNIWGISMGYMLLIMANNGMLTWIPSYLVREKHYSFIKMGFMAALPWVGGFIGSSFGGWLSDKVFGRRRKPTMLITTFMTAVLMVVLIHVPNNLTLVAITLVTIGFFLHLGYPGFTAYTMSLTDKQTFPGAISLVNSVGNLGGFFSPIIAGLILDIFKVYNAAFAYFGIAALLAFGCIFMLDEPESR